MSARRPGPRGVGKLYSWPEDAVTSLRELWGRTPASRIADHINATWPEPATVTKNSVIGKAHKLDLPTQRRAK